MEHHINNRTCAFCFVDFKPEDKVHPVHPEKGWVFPEYHIWPDGTSMFGNRIPNGCLENKAHQSEPHIHNGCVNGWEDRFNLETVKDRDEAHVLDATSPAAKFTGTTGIESFIGMLKQEKDVSD
jgi:hypothetical protein